MSDHVEKPGIARGLSVKILTLTVAFMLAGEILIFLPSVARFRSSYLAHTIAAAELAAVAFEASPNGTVTPDVEQQLLKRVGARSITLWRPDAKVILGLMAPVDQVFDLRQTSFAHQIIEALQTMAMRRDRIIRVIAPSLTDRTTSVDLIMVEAPMRDALFAFAGRILALSIILSTIVGALLFFSLQRMIVIPISSLSRGLAAFRRQPEDTGHDLSPTARTDEIGIAQREFALMRDDMRQALSQNRRLAALGAAVSQITHDLRNVLGASVLLSDRLERSEDPTAKAVGPRLITALERAVRLCTDTLDFARGRRQALQSSIFALSPLVDEVRETITAAGLPSEAWTSNIPDALRVEADRDELFRVLLNLARNARDSTEAQDPGRVEVTATRAERAIFIYITDDGPGIAADKRATLFETFVPSSRPDGAGLGLVICREIMRAHGGDVDLVGSEPGSTTFRLTLPIREI